MKVYIGPHKRWIGPYQIAEKILFWRDKDDDVVFNLGVKLSGIKWLVRFCEWVDSKKKRTVKVKIHDYDVWSFDYTLAKIIHPALLKLRDAKMGSPYVDDEDVPEHLRSTSVPSKENDWELDDNFHKRWEYVLNEMIHAFGVLVQDSYTTIEEDRRIYNGLRLFGKYYMSLWS